MLGSQATYVAVPFQLRLLTHSTLAVGSIGLVELAPLVIFGLYGGVLADRMNRRRLILIMEIVLMASTALLLANALLAHPITWILYVDAAIVAAASSLQSPSVSAMNQIFVSPGSAAFGLGSRQRERDDGVDHRPGARGSGGGRLRPGFGLLRQRRHFRRVALSALSTSRHARASRGQRRA